MDIDTFVVITKAIAIEGFEDIVISVTIEYKGESFEEQIPIKIPMFISHGQKVIEAATYEAYWKMKKHWNKLNGIPLQEVSVTPPEGAHFGPDQHFKSAEDSEDTENTSE